MSVSKSDKGLVRRLGAMQGFPTLTLYKKRQVFRCIVDYMMGRCSQRDTTMQCVAVSGLEEAEFTKAIAEVKLDGSVTTFKLWLFYCAKHRLDTDKAKRMGRAWGVQRRDVREGLALSKQYRRELGDSPYHALTMEEFRQVQQYVYKTTVDWRGKFVYRKLRFVYQSNGMEQNDLSGEILLHGLRAVGITCTRLESPLHAVNIAKRAMHNYGMTLIKAATTAKKSRLKRNDNGTFEATVLPIGEVQTNTMPCPAADGERRELELRSTAARIISDVKCPKKRQFLHLLSGAHCPAFDTFLATKRKRALSSEDVGSKLNHETHVSLIAEYLGVPVVKCVSFLDSIRGAYVNPFA